VPPHLLFNDWLNSRGHQQHITERLENIFVHSSVHCSSHQNGNLQIHPLPFHLLRQQKAQQYHSDPQPQCSVRYPSLFVRSRTTLSTQDPRIHLVHTPKCHPVHWPWILRDLPHLSPKTPNHSWESLMSSMPDLRLRLGRAKGEHWCRMRSRIILPQ
jgi:hypothetical protein